MNRQRCDVAVIGGGPAGAAAATVLARAGLEAVVVERERFPRFHVGESLLPLQGAVLERLGVAEAVAARAYVPKHGAWFVSNDGACETPIDFALHVRPPHNSAYEVERADFDQLLLRHAAATGARVLEEHAVVAAELAPGDCRLTVRGADAETEIACRWVVDASGQSSFLARRLDLRVNEPGLSKVAHFAHFSGGRRRQGRREGDITIVLGRGCWFWHIPLRGDRVSVGCVLDRERWRGSGLSAEDSLEQAIASSPWVRDWLREARRQTPVHTLANFSYTARRFAGPGWLLAGDAATFLDPIFSTGVYLALRSGEEAGRRLAAALRSGRTPPAGALAGYERRLRRWSSRYFRMIRAFYRPEFAGVLFNPNPFFVRPVVHFLAGRLDLPWWDRLWLEVFYLVVHLNRRLPLTPDPRGPEAAFHHG